MGAAARYASNDERWSAIRRRDGAADGQFYYLVHTTRVYNRPSCGARLANRENIAFSETIEQARAAGYRPCRRCRPDEASPDHHHAEAVIAACRAIAAAEAPPCLQELARAAGFSRFHFHRVFKACTGITPHAYIAADRADRLRGELLRGRPVSDAIYSAGFGSNGRFYAASTQMLGMTPTAFRAGGDGESIRFALGRSFLGPALVAATAKGVCAVLLGDCDLPAELHRRFGNARVDAGEPAFARRVQTALSAATPPDLGRSVLSTEVRQVLLRQRVYQQLATAGSRRSRR